MLETALAFGATTSVSVFYDYGQGSLHKVRNATTRALMPSAAALRPNTSQCAGRLSQPAASTSSTMPASGRTAIAITVASRHSDSRWRGWWSHTPRPSDGRNAIASTPHRHHLHPDRGQGDQGVDGDPQRIQFGAPRAELIGRP